MVHDLYQETILDHSKHPRNCHELCGANHHAEGFNPLCGDKLKLYLKLKDDVVEDASFVVDLVRATRQRKPGKNPPTIRACIAMARVMGQRGERPDPEDAFFRAVCQDVLCGHRGGAGLRWTDQQLWDLMREMAPAGHLAPTSKAA